MCALCGRCCHSNCNNIDHRRRRVIVSGKVFVIFSVLHAHTRCFFPLVCRYVIILCAYDSSPPSPITNNIRFSPRAHVAFHTRLRSRYWSSPSSFGNLKRPAVVDHGTRAERVIRPPSAAATAVGLYPRTVGHHPSSSTRHDNVPLARHIMICEMLYHDSCAILSSAKYLLRSR